MKFITNRLNLRWLLPSSTASRGVRKPVYLRAADGLTFGIFPVVVLATASLAIQLLVQPVLVLFNSVGLLVYSLILLVSGALALDCSIQLRFTEPTCARYGLAAGLLFWSCIRINLISTSNANQDYLPVVGIAATLIVVATLWKRVLPVGVKFFALSLMASWILHSLFSSFYNLAADTAHFQTSKQIIGIFFMAAASVCGIRMFRVDTKIQKLWAALGGWVCMMAALAAFLNDII